jgi:alpha-mannosidase
LDISNEDYGITIGTPDAPIWEVGDMYGQLWMKDMKKRQWLNEYQPSQRLFNWVMNNAWFVNYKAYQEGSIPFRYTLRPHRGYSNASVKKFGLELTNPLLVVPAEPSSRAIPSTFTLEGDTAVIVSSFKPSDDGKAWMIRLFNCGTEEGSVEIQWGNRKPKAVFESNPQEEMGQEINESEISLVPWEIKTIRAEIN